MPGIISAAFSMLIVIVSLMLTTETKPEEDSLIWKLFLVRVVVSAECGNLVSYVLQFVMLCILTRIYLL